MMQALRKVKDMATVSSDGSSGLSRYLQPAVNVIVAAAVLGLIAVSQTASKAYDTSQNNEKRIQSLESTPVRISVLETKVDNLTDQVAEIRQDNKEMLTMMRMQRGQRNDR